MEFEFHTAEARDAIVMTSLQLDYLLDEFEAELADRPLHEQVESVTNDIVASTMFTHEHAVLTLAICFVRLMDARTRASDPDGPVTS